MNNLHLQQCLVIAMKCQEYDEKQSYIFENFELLIFRHPSSRIVINLEVNRV